ncbi:cupin domain-containing protein [Streptomyces sp. S.PNR 29]|uniref:JmjC domain-containing protein n=1 Tax=Streptomyces sp. S.PNR 29 TaxID=2973805 RepID=UPI0025AF3A3B|nr:cupin domain-containing protein [Streptomyces sp. S.PNR 29]MDN0194142.1 cupin domain-containing protein [Streptomyces sp. S.PNR 29]
MALDRLLDDPARLPEIRDRTPHVSRGLGPLDDVFTTGHAQDLLFHRGLRTPYVRLLRDGGELDVRPRPAGAARGGAVGEHRQLSGLADPHHVLAQIDAGATLVLQSLALYCPEVAAFCEALADETGYPVSPTAFLTPPGARGAAPHYDLSGVFIRQLAGAKTWCVRAPRQTLPVVRGRAGDVPDTPVVLETRLEPGDCLYVPRGFYHEGRTDGEGSVHLSFSEGTEDAWIGLLHDVLDLAADELLALRTRLPALDDVMAGRSRQEWHTVRDSLLEHLRTFSDEKVAALIVRRMRARQVPSAPAPGALADRLALKEQF